MLKNVNIKNYTSTVPASKSVSRIEELLVSMGASNITKSYKDNELDSITFLCSVNGNTVPFKLPAKRDQVYEALKKSYKRLSTPALRNLAEQSTRTAWKICCDWVEIQATVVRLQQAEFIEVFLPYVYDVDKDRTFFEKLQQTHYKALLQ